MVSRRGVLAGLMGASVAPLAWAQTPMRGADLAGDIAILREAYETLHPGLYRYTPRAEMSARFDALAAAWTRDQTRAKAYLTLSRFLASVRCGHTYANFYNQRRAVRAELFDGGAQRLPFHFRWLRGRMIVTANHADDARLAPGAEILSVNGERAPRILRALSPYARADGGNDAKRVALMEARGYDDYESFDVFHTLLFPNDGAVRLRVRPFGGRAQNIEVAGLDLATRRANKVAANEGPGWTLAFPNGNAALLTMPDWALYNSDWDWRAFLDDAFAQIAARGVGKLIVDIRGNEGGLDCGHDIVARCIDAPLTLETELRRVRYRRTPEHLNAYLDTWDDSFRDWGDRAQAREDGWYELQAEGETAAIEPKGPRFRGELIVLTDAQNSSATFQFAQLVQANRLGRLIGGPTGGNQRGINGGSFFFLRLPASGIEADLPLVGFLPRTPKPDAGIAPDVAITLTCAHIAAGRDGVLEAALR